MLRFVLVANLKLPTFGRCVFIRKNEQKVDQMSKKRGTLHFLGTGTSQGVPIIGCECDVCQSSDPRDARSRSSVHVEYNGVHLQIDTGPDFRSQMLREKLSRVDAVLFTHEHQDHIAGLDDTRPIIFRTGNNMQVYGQSRVIDRIKKVYDYAFEDQPYPGAPKIDAHIIDEHRSFRIKDVEITPLPIIHGKLPILGFRIGDMAYLTDTNQIPASTMKLLKGLDILILDALHHRNHFSHYTLEQAVEKANEIGARKTYFIHMSHYMGRHEDVEKTLKQGQQLAYDGLKVQFD